MLKKGQTVHQTADACY